MGCGEPRGCRRAARSAARHRRDDPRHACRLYALWPDLLCSLLRRSRRAAARVCFLRDGRMTPFRVTRLAYIVLSVHDVPATPDFFEHASRMAVREALPGKSSLPLGEGTHSLQTAASCHATPRLTTP